MQRNLLETVMGGLILLAALGFLFVIYNDGGVKKTENGYQLNVRFDRADGLIPGTDVRIAGIKVGSVLEQRLDPITYRAIIIVNIDPAVKLSTDTVAKITSDGLLGNNYLALVPGAEEENLQPGGEILHTQGAVNVLELFAKYAFGSSGEK